LRGSSAEEGILTFKELVAAMRKESPGRVTVVSYASLKRANERGVDCWEYAATISFQHVVHDYGTPEEQQRLRKMKVGYPW
jgi:hypothetical protein